MSSEGRSPSFRPPTRNNPIGLSLSLNTASPSLRPPTSNRPRANILPSLSIKTNPTEVSNAYSASVGAPVILTSSTTDESSPSSDVEEENDFGKQVRKFIGDDGPKALQGQFERMNLSTSADGDDEATPPASEEISTLDEEGWRKAARDGGIVEIDVLGEGSSGSVSRCRLRHGTQEFALKVDTYPFIIELMTDHSLRSTDAKTNIARVVFQSILRLSSYCEILYFFSYA
jgi:hypothetical protein